MKILFIGRFQPFHMGHLEAAKRLDKMGDLIVAVGSAQYGSTFYNPFNYGERMLMIKRALSDAGITPLDVVPVKDIHNHQRWAEHVKASVPEYDAVFTNSEVDRSIFKFAGDNVLEKWYYDREELRGRFIREAMARGDHWRHMVPDAVAGFLDEIGAVERLRGFKEKGKLIEDDFAEEAPNRHRY